MLERPGNALMPNLLTPMDLEPNWEWRDKLPAHGHMSVDFERRIDHDRLRRYRLARTRQSLKNSNAGTLLLFDVSAYHRTGWVFLFLETGDHPRFSNACIIKLSAYIYENLRPI